MADNRGLPRGGHLYLRVSTMKLLELHPEWLSKGPRDILTEIQSDTLFHLLDITAAYYEQALPLWRVLNYYGVDTIDANTESEHVPCRLLSHGTVDKHTSARYFTTDRNTGEHRPAFYCYKCQKMLTSFWFLYKQERDISERNLRGIYEFILDNFNIAPPIDQWLEFDPDLHFTFDENAEPDLTAARFEQALKVRMLKQVDSKLYLEGLKNLLLVTTMAPVQNAK